MTAEPSHINSHDSWSPLKEVWLGDVYPRSWYDHLEPRVRDVFRDLTDITQQDLDAISQTLTDLGIRVRRPVYDSIDHYLRDGQLIKPEICPRDTNLVLGDTLYTGWSPSAAWQRIRDQYRTVPGNHIHCVEITRLNGANVVRVGRDIIIDTDIFEFRYANQFPSDYRVTMVNNGGHMDGCFAILRPGLLLANHYFDAYDTTFPGWEIIFLDDPEFGASPSTGYQQCYPVYNGKFWDTTVGTNSTFNQHIIDHALDWVGCYTETYFELNCLVVDPNNVVMLSKNLQLERRLAAHGITVHWVPFRARSFWDGAMHCLTLDVTRDSKLCDYFPERGA